MCRGTEAARVLLIGLSTDAEHGFSAGLGPHNAISLAHNTLVIPCLVLRAGCDFAFFFFVHNKFRMAVSITYYYPRNVILDVFGIHRLLKSVAKHEKIFDVWDLSVP